MSAHSRHYEFAEHRQETQSFCCADTWVRPYGRLGGQVDIGGVFLIAIFLL